MNFSSHRPFSTALVSLLFAVAGCGSHDSNVGTSQLASDELRGKGGSGACGSAKGPGYGVVVDCQGGDVMLDDDGLECKDLLNKCQIMGTSNPSLSFTCNWNGSTIFEQEVKAGLCDDDQGGSSGSGGSGGSGGGGVGCGFAKGPGVGEAVECTSNQTILRADGIECDDLLAKCEGIAQDNPSFSFTCTFEGVTVFEQEAKAGICDGVDGGGSGGSGGSGVGCDFAKAPGVGVAVECTTGSVFIKASEIECDAVLEKCSWVAKSDPSANITCTFDGVTIFEQEAKAGMCDAYGGSGGSGGSGGGGGGCGFAKAPGVGVAVDCLTAGVVIKAGGIECDDMLAKCEGIAKGDPTLNLSCTFDGVTIFEQEAKAGICDGFGGGSGGSGGAGGASGACALGEIEVPACAAGQVPTTSCGAARCVDFEHYLDAVDNCPPPDQVVLDCYDLGASTESCSLECR